MIGFIIELIHIRLKFDNFLRPQYLLQKIRWFSSISIRNPIKKKSSCSFHNSYFPNSLKWLIFCFWHLLLIKNVVIWQTISNNKDDNHLLNFTTVTFLKAANVPGCFWLNFWRFEVFLVLIFYLLSRLWRIEPLLLSILFVLDCIGVPIDLILLLFLYFKICSKRELFFLELFYFSQLDFLEWISSIIFPKDFYLFKSLNLWGCELIEEYCTLDRMKYFSIRSLYA